MRCDNRSFKPNTSVLFEQLQPHPIGKILHLGEVVGGSTPSMKKWEVRGRVEELGQGRSIGHDEGSRWIMYADRFEAT